MTIEVVDTLVEAGLIEHEKGFKDRKTGIGRMSRMWPTDVLTDLFQGASFGPLDVVYTPDRETIVLRDKDGDDLKYDDTDQTKQMRGVVERYNALLARTYVDIPTLEGRYIDLGLDGKGNPKRIAVNQRDKFTRRVFNRGSFELGGRFYGGWWQGAPSDWRAQIFMEDHPTSEIDYSGLHIVLLYANRNIDYWRTINQDPYKLDPTTSLLIRFACERLPRA